MDPWNPFVVVHPRVHRAHQLKSAELLNTYKISLLNRVVAWWVHELELNQNNFSCREYFGGVQLIRYEHHFTSSAPRIKFIL